MKEFSNQQAAAINFRISNPQAPHDTNVAWLTNQLAFDHPRPVITFMFHDTEQPEAFCCQASRLPGDRAALFGGDGNEKTKVWTNFLEEGEGIPVTIELARYPFIARAYYTALIRHLVGKWAKVTVTNFLSDTVFWFHKPEENNSEFSIYERYTARVTPDKANERMLFAVTYDGESRVLNRTLAQLSQTGTFDTGLLNHVIYHKQLYRYQYNLPDEAMHNQGQVYPVLNRSLAAHLGIRLPFKLNKRKYPEMYQKITGFVRGCINREEFLDVIPVRPAWVPADPGETDQLNYTRRRFVFGNDQKVTDVYQGMKSFGPAVMPPGRNFKVFLVYFEGDERFKKTLESYLTQGSGFGSLSAFTRLPYSYDESMNIKLSHQTDPVNELEKQLRVMAIDEECRYYAFYLSPYTKWETNTELKGIYYRIKEIMLQHEIGMQAIETGKIADNFSNAIANIGIAMIAKLGGIPWKLDHPYEEELIIGFGAYKSKRFNRKYIGSALCFSNDGTYSEYDCFPDDEPWNLAGLAEDAIRRYTEHHPGIERLIIHYYKEVGLKELKPVEQMLRRLKFDIPVFVVNISEFSAGGVLVFDNRNPEKIPLNGTYFHLGNQQYLLCNNERENADSAVRSLLLPIKASLYCSDPELLNDHEMTNKLLQHVYNLSFMHWRSVKQKALPVTITFPRLMAEMFQGFKGQNLAEEGRNKPFFL